MYVGSHSNPYLASISMQRGGTVQQLAASKTGQNVFVSAPSRNVTVSSNASAGYLSSLKTGASELRTALNTLTGGKPFNLQTAKSSDEAALTVSKKSGSSDLKDDMSVEISQLASTQKNVGEQLNSSALVGQDGYHQFAITVGGKEHTLAVSVSSKDSYKDLQNKMASAINGADLGITASVTSAKGKSSLVIESEKSGDSKANIFKLHDISGSAVALTGADTTVKEAQDAVYSVNGDIRTSASNTVDFGNGITGTLKKTTENAVTVSQGADSKTAIDAMQKLADSYNKLLSSALSNSTDSRAGKLVSDLTGASGTYLDSLVKLGIGFDGNGNMTINESAMKSAVEDGSLERFFTENNGGNYGFAAQLGKVASSIDSNIGRYAGAETFTQASSGSSGSSNTQDAAAYKSLLASNGYGSAWNISNMYTGILFSSLF